MLSAVECVRAVIAEAWKFFQFSSRRDSKVCPECNKYDYSIMTRTEIEATFPYLEKKSATLWYPHVHPNCRCELRFEEEEEGEDVERIYVGDKKRQK